MAISQIEVDEVAARLPELMKEVGHGGEVVITKDDRPVAKLVGYTQTARKRQPGSARGLITLAGDWDAPLDGFEQYTR